MSLPAKVIALLAWLKSHDFSTMTPAARRHLRDLCRFIADRAACFVPRKRNANAIKAQQKQALGAKLKPCCSYCKTLTRH
jgi:hypothetical protein